MFVRIALVVAGAWGSSVCPLTAEHAHLDLLVNGRFDAGKSVHPERTVYFVKPLSPAGITALSRWLADKQGKHMLQKIVQARPYDPERMVVVSSNMKPAMASAFGSMAHLFKPVDELRVHVVSALQEVKSQPFGDDDVMDAGDAQKGFTKSDVVIKGDEAMAFFDFRNAVGSINGALTGTKKDGKQNRVKRFCKWLARRSEQHVLVFGHPVWLEQLAKSLNHNGPVNFNEVGVAEFHLVPTPLDGCHQARF